MDMFLFLIGIVGIVVSLVLLVINLIKKKPKKKTLISLVVCFALLIVGLSMPSSGHDDKQGAEVDKKNNIEDSGKEEPKTPELTESDKLLLSKHYAELDSDGRTVFSEILDKFDSVPEEERKELTADVDRMKQERDEWVKEQDRIAKEQEQKKAEEDKAKEEQKWEEVITFEGESIKDTQTFNITSEEWRIVWETKPSKLGDMNFQIYVYTSDGEPANPSVVANVIGAANDESFMRGSGGYYLTINTAQPYKIVIQQKK